MKYLFLLLVFTSSLASAQENKPESTTPSPTSKPATFRINCGYNPNTAKPPLLLVNGFVIDINTLSKVNPNLILSVNVLKDKTAIEQFGEKGRNGVLSIQVKPELITTLTQEGVIKQVL